MCAIVFTRGSVQQTRRASPSAPSRSCPLCISNIIWNSCSLCPHLVQLDFSIFSPSSFRSHSCVHFARRSWPMPDRQVMNWRKSTSVQSRANHWHQQPHPYLSSVSLFLLLSPLSRSAVGADSLAPAPWRHPIHCSPRASPRGAAEAVSMDTGFLGCQSEVVLSWSTRGLNQASLNSGYRV